MVLSKSVCAVERVEVERLADAIELAENSHAHPYGIMRSYCKAGDPDGQCRKGCIQTIQRRLQELEGKAVSEDFISYLGKFYAPVGMGKGSNDPKNLNKNWVKNVKYFYKRG